MGLLEDIEKSIIVADGAMGTLLIERGIDRNRCFEELCISAPRVVSDVHRDYIAAGARIIKTNSFGGNEVRLARFGLEHHVNEINWQSAQIAKEAAKGTGVRVAGSLGPLGLAGEEAVERGIDRAAVFREQMGALLDGGVNLILLETFQDIDELSIALHVKQELHHCPVICSLSPAPNGLLFDGTPLANAFARLTAEDADVVGINCAGDPSITLTLLEGTSPGCKVAVFPNAGQPKPVEGGLVYRASPEDFAAAVPALVSAGAIIIGGCCGTTPAHISAIAKAVRGIQPGSPPTAA